MISKDFRQEFVEDVLPPTYKRNLSRCAWCGWHWRPRPGIDIGMALALGLASRVSFGSVVAEELGWAVPWRVRFQIQPAVLDADLRTVASMIVDGGMYELSIKAVPMAPELEQCGKRLVMDLLRKNPPPSVNLTHATSIFGPKLDERWPMADFHTCGRSLTRAVRRVVTEFEKL